LILLALLFFYFFVLSSFFLFLSFFLLFPFSPLLSEFSSSLHHFFEFLFQSELAKLPSLTELQLSSNRLTSLPDNFHLLGPILMKLEVNENHFDSWPFSSPSRSTSSESYSTPPPVFTALKFLNVSHHNRMGSSFPYDAFVVFPSLTHLKLGRIGLRSLPSSLTTLFSLEHLSLEMNYLTTLPPSFLNLKRLRHLNLSYNDFSEETFKEVVEVLGKKGVFFLISSSAFSASSVSSALHLPPLLLLSFTHILFSFRELKTIGGTFKCWKSNRNLIS
jgi:hypothetical protein